MSIAEVDALKWANEAMERYREGYKRRYGTQPILDQHLPATVLFKRLAKSFGREHLLGLVEFYLRTNGDNDWYARKGHSIDTMAKSIDAINAAYSLSKQRALPAAAGFDPAVSFWTGCRNAERGCREQFEVTCKASQAEKYAYSVSCPKCRENPERLFSLGAPKGTGPIVKGM